jgi:sugar phosphate isomerase/epimerase
MDGKEPGMGNYDFAKLLKCLTDLHYDGWVSLEAFDFTRDPKEIISRSISHLTKI